MVNTNQWNGKNVAFLGDSITDKIHVGTEKNYWQFLQEYLGLNPWVYGINGHNWCGIFEQAQKLLEEKSDTVDAIFIFAGTNDFNSCVPLGDWWNYSYENANRMGKISVVKRRSLQKDSNTFRGRINITMEFIKEKFPRQQIILLTPIHRGFATFSEENVQPEETVSNSIGLFIDDYVKVVKEAANVWAVPVIDLNCLSGLYPLTLSHHPFFHLEDTDLLHPAAEGHQRMALAMAYQMLALPSTFK